MDFRDVALALAALDGGRSLEELTRLAFEVSGRWGGRHVEAVLTLPGGLCSVQSQVPPDGRRSVSQGHAV